MKATGKLPPFSLRKLKELCWIITDGTHQTPRYVENGIPFISTANLTPFRPFKFNSYRRFISKEEHLFLTKRCKPEIGDMLVSKIGTLGLSKCVDVDYEFSIFVGLALLKLRRELICPEFIEQLLNSDACIDAMLSASPGSTRSTLTLSAIEKLEVLVPESLPEQAKIAEVLSTVDRGINQTEALIRKQQRVKTGLMADLLTRGIDSDGNLRSEATHAFKDSPLGRIPVEWECCNMGAYTNASQGLQIPIEKRFKESGKGRYQYITVQFLNNPDKYSEYIEKPRVQLVCSKEDILFTRTGNTGQIVSGVTGVFHNNFFKVSFDPKVIVGSYLISYLRWKPIQDLIRDLAGTTTIPDLNHGDFYSLPFLLPPIEEQEKVAELIAHENKLMIQFKSELKKLRSLKTACMQDLLTGQVRVTDLLED